MFQAIVLFFLSTGSIAVLGNSPPYDPAAELRQKQEYCQDLLALQRKLPEKYQSVYANVQTRLCPDDAVKIYDIFTYINEQFTKNEQTEIHVIQNGRANYCKFIFGLSRLYRIDGKASEEAPDGVTAPQYKQLKAACDQNPTSEDVSDIIPLAQQLANIYHHF